MVKPFVMDGIAYNVSVEALERSFSISETAKPMYAMSGDVYRDITGTYINYTMIVSSRNGDKESFDAFWDAILQPVKSHDCVFPYNQTTLSQKMYVTSGKQAIRKITENGIDWQSVKIQFIATAPQVIP